MRDCPHCGHGVRQDAAFCGSCGLALPDALPPVHASTIVDAPVAPVSTAPDLDAGAPSLIGATSGSPPGSLPATAPARPGTAIEYGGAETAPSSPPTAPNPSPTISLDFDMDAPTVVATSASISPAAPSLRSDTNTLQGGFKQSEPPPAPSGKPVDTTVSIAPPPYAAAPLATSPLAILPSEPPTATAAFTRGDETRAEVRRSRTIPPLDGPGALGPYGGDTVGGTQSSYGPASYSQAPASVGAYVAPAESSGVVWWLLGTVLVICTALAGFYVWNLKRNSAIPEYAAAVQVDAYGRNYIGVTCQHCVDGTAITLLRQNGEFHGRTASLVLPPLAGCGLTRIPVTITPPGGTSVPWDADVEVPVSLRTDMSKVGDPSPIVTLTGCVADGVHTEIEGKPWDGSALDVPLADAVTGPSETTISIKKSIHYVVTPRAGSPVMGELSVGAMVTPLRELGPKPGLADKTKKVFLLQTLPDARATLSDAAATVDARGVFEVPVAVGTSVDVRVVRAGMAARQLRVGPVPP